MCLTIAFLIIAVCAQHRIDTAPSALPHIGFLHAVDDVLLVCFALLLVQGTNIYLQMLLSDNLMHADLHPGTNVSFEYRSKGPGPDEGV